MCFSQKLPCISPNVGEEKIEGKVYPKEVVTVRDRKRQRANHKLKVERERRQRQEELLDRRNDCGVKDLTAYNAVLQIKTNGKADIALR